MDSLWNNYGNASDSMISLKFRSLFPIAFTFRKWGILWRRIGYCCGLAHYEPQVLLLIRFCFTDTYYWRCPQCGKLHGLRFYYHAVLVNDKKTKKNNQELKR